MIWWLKLFLLIPLWALGIMLLFIESILDLRDAVSSINTLLFSTGRSLRNTRHSLPHSGSASTIHDRF